MKSTRKTSLEIDGRTVSMGDFLKVKFCRNGWLNEAIIEGEVDLLLVREDGQFLGRLSGNYWCFTNYDEVLDSPDPN